MSKVDAEETFKGWLPSPGAEIVSDVETIKKIATFCRYVAEEMWGKIEFFESDMFEAKKLVDADKLSKSEVFGLAATQLIEFEKVWQVRQAKYPERLTYEFPLIVNVDNKLRYMKFQIAEGVKGLASPAKVKKVWLRYHKSVQTELEVKYVEIE